MKNLLLISVLSLFTGIINAQKIKLQKVTFGVVVPISGTLTLTAPLKQPTLGYNLLPNLCFVTNKTYHNFLYGIGNNAGRTIQGFKPRKDVGIYLALQKSLSKKGGYVGIGIEKFFPLTDNVTCFLFSEIGMNTGPVNSKVLTIGIHTNIQSLIWKK